MNILQEKELDVLKEIIIILKKHNLTYYAIGGTCLGAIRHAGFIPWDDDIDIAMPRKDYELFRNIYYNELPQKIKKIDCDEFASYRLILMKIHDEQTTHIEKAVEFSPECYTGAFVDIMPVDGICNGVAKQKKIVKLVNALNYLNGKIRPLAYKPKSFQKQLVYFLKSLFCKIFSYNFFSNIIVKILERYDYDQSDYVMFTWRLLPKNSNYKMVFPRRYFENCIEVPFEESMISVPGDYDSYLTDDFGNYMQLPPEEKRNGEHNVYISDMKKPCSYYAEIKRKEIENLKESML